MARKYRNRRCLFVNPVTQLRCSGFATENTMGMWCPNHATPARRRSRDVEERCRRPGCTETGTRDGWCEKHNPRTHPDERLPAPEGPLVVLCGRCDNTDEHCPECVGAYDRRAPIL